MTGSPWPRVEVGGRLDNAEREWIHTNGAGAYASSTVAMMHTRRYHGVLVAALDPPARRFAIVSHAETDVVTARRTYRLAAHQFPEVAPSPGFRYLEHFAQDPLPRWTYRLGKVRFERVLGLVRGENTVVLRYTWFGRKKARLVLSPLMSMRDHHTVMHEHGGMVQRVRMRPHEVEIRPVPKVPPIVFGHSGVFVGSPDWYRRFEHAEDKLRGIDAEEDLWTPGTFELELLPEVPVYFTVALGALPAAPPEESLAAAAKYLESTDPGPERPVTVRRLCIAADAYCVDAGRSKGVIAGYPWLGPETRDALIALPGLFLVRGEIERARAVVEHATRIQHEGLLPRRLHGQRGRRPAADASLWLFETCRLFLEATSHEDPFARAVILPALTRAFERVTNDDRSILWLSKDGLVANGNAKAALTWMDASTGDLVATPRTGLAVEFQALWTRGCDTLGALADRLGDAELGRRAHAARDRAREAFGRRFWCPTTDYAYDCIREQGNDAGPIADSSIRPNALIALDVDPALFSRKQAVSILERVRDRLFTPRGVRSLDPDDPAYKGAYAGDLPERRLSYHQGLAWTHLFGAFARAALRLRPDDFDLVEDLRHMIESALADGDVLGQVMQFADGAPPFTPGGCPAYAPSVAELLRTLVWDLHV